MNSLTQFKKDLEQYLNIVEWNPSNSQIQDILDGIENKHTKEDVLQVVFNIYGEDIIFLGLEGVDNSDINSLLLLATKVRKDGN